MNNIVLLNKKYIIMKINVVLTCVSEVVCMKKLCGSVVMILLLILMVVREMRLFTSCCGSVVSLLLPSDIW